MPETKIFVLAAGHNKHTEKPCSLWSLSNGKSILDWQIHAFEMALPGSKVNIVVGYDYKRIIDHYPSHNFLHAFNWENSRALHSFLSIINNYSSAALLMYGDTVFHPKSLRQITEARGDAVIAIDSTWKQRFVGRSSGDIAIAEVLDLPSFGEVEYAGLVKFSPNVMRWISNHRNHYRPHSGFVDLIKDIQEAGFSVVPYDLVGNWAEMNEPNDLIHFILGSKAETLSRIKPKLKKSKICDQLTCTWKNWKSNPAGVIAKTQSKFAGHRLIVRSSSVEEDGWETANAGVFKSVLDIDCNDSDAMHKAIEGVFLSYAEPPSHSQVLIQPYISDVAMSGVIFTCDLATGAPYYIINYDDVSGRTDSITSGQVAESRTAILTRETPDAALAIDRRLASVIEAAKELEHILGYNKLDIEFAIDKNGQVFTFQIRPIAVKHDAYQINDQQLNEHLHSSCQQFISWQKKPPHILGDSTIFSGMTDWNPAEIIGNRPNALAINLYNHLITEEVWAKQRVEFGYRDVRPAPLVHNFCSQPYVDCRTSINSFIPASLPEDTASRLANVYLDLLRANPWLHDKLELDVVFTIWVPTFQEEAKKRFKDSSLSEKDISLLEQTLKKLTADALVHLNEDMASIRILAKRFALVAGSDLDPVEKVYQLIEDCRSYGTSAFSHAARAGFVAVALLKSLVKLGSLTQERMLEFQASVPTVASDFQFAVFDPNFKINDLLKQFGHLRPGTYDVTQVAYWENPDNYFIRKADARNPLAANDREFVFTRQEREGLQLFLDGVPTEVDVDQLVEFLGHAIQGREKTKFEFSRNLSTALDIMIQYGSDVLGLTREDVGYLTFDDFRALRTGQLDEKTVSRFVELRKASFAEKHLAKLPSFISRKEDFFGYEQEKSQANFITRSSVVADLVFINASKSEQINGKIVAVPNADPGFDWIFLHNIAGLITQYGGGNSHMAIRCAELGIPAAIGIGDKRYESLHEGRMMLDCHKGQFEYV